MSEPIDLAPEDPTPKRVAKAAQAGSPAPLTAEQARGLLAEAEARERAEAEKAEREEGSLDGQPLDAPLVPADLAQWRVVAGMGAALTLAAMIVAYARSAYAPFVEFLVAGYSVVLHACLALGALYFQARLEQRPMGNWREALARFFCAIAAFALLLRIGWVGGSTDSARWWSLAIGAVVGGAAFFGLVMLLLRWPARRVAMVAGIQLLIVVALTLHHWLRDMVEQAATR
jgi:hypothetical protein